VRPTYEQLYNALKQIRDQDHAENCPRKFAPLPECGCQPSPRMIAEITIGPAE